MPPVSGYTGHSHQACQEKQGLSSAPTQGVLGPKVISQNLGWRGESEGLRTTTGCSWLLAGRAVRGHHLASLCSSLSSGLKAALTAGVMSQTNTV